MGILSQLLYFRKRVFFGQEKTSTELAYAEVISYNKKNLERELQSESRQHNRQQGKMRRGEGKK